MRRGPISSFAVEISIKKDRLVAENNNKFTEIDHYKS